MSARRTFCALSIVALAVATSLAAASYFSPYWTVQQIREAAQARDTRALEQHVDFVTVREHLKTDLHGAVKTVADTSSPVAALGETLLAVVGDPLIDRVVTPQNLVRLLDGASAVKGRDDTSGGNQQQPSADRHPDMTLRYDSFSLASVQLRQQPEDGPMEIELSRDGPFSWRLTRIRLH